MAVRIVEWSDYMGGCPSFNKSYMYKEIWYVREFLSRSSKDTSIYTNLLHYRLHLLLGYKLACFTLCEMTLRLFNDSTWNDALTRILHCLTYNGSFICRFTEGPCKTDLITFKNKNISLCGWNTNPFKHKYSSLFRDFTNK